MIALFASSSHTNSGNRLVWVNPHAFGRTVSWRHGRTAASKLSVIINRKNIYFNEPTPISNVICLKFIRMIEINLSDYYYVSWCWNGLRIGPSALRVIRDSRSSHDPRSQFKEAIIRQFMEKRFPIDRLSLLPGCSIIHHVKFIIHWHLTSDRRLESSTHDCK